MASILNKKVVNRKKRRSIMEFVSILKDDAEYWDNFKKEIRKSRMNSKMREVKL